MATLRVDLRSDLYQQGSTEDGEPSIFEAYSVIVETEAGFRWQHTKTFFGHQMGDDNAKAAAERLAGRIEAALANWKGPANNENWVVVQPCYGSPAYAKNWRAYAAADDLADGSYDTPEREAELRAIASTF
jgi:hypothetical protein